MEYATCLLSVVHTYPLIMNVSSVFYYDVLVINAVRPYVHRLQSQGIPTTFIAPVTGTSELVASISSWMDCGGIIGGGATLFVLQQQLCQGPVIRLIMTLSHIHHLP